VHILVVDDNKTSADALARALKRRGDDAEAVYDGQSAIERMGVRPPDLILTDLRMEPVDGIQVLRAARDLRPPVEVIVFTAYGAIETAVEAMQLGARDFLTKPVTLEQLVRRIEDLSGPGPAPLSPSTATTQAPDRPSPTYAPTTEAADEFTAHAEASVELYDTLRRMADVPSPVWIEGEIGSGRGHVALTLHRLRDANQPFVVADPARDAPWPTEGTVLIPNVDTLPADLQRSLVRRLAQRPPGLRLVVTSGPDARQRVAEGSLDPHLYYDLAVIVVAVPPLRERQEDIIPMMRSALAQLSARYRRPAPALPPELEDRLMHHSWPGNVRELFNLAERAVVLGPDALRLETVRAATPGLPVLEPGFSLSDWMDRMERRILAEALRRTDGDRNAAGRLLNVERNTLRYKLVKHKLIDR
jgi:two-component system response regulator HydG